MAALRETADTILSHVGSYDGPVLSMYLDANPAHQGNHPKTVFLRAKSAMHDLDVDPEVAERVLARLEEDSPRGRTLAIFATRERIDVFDLEVDLPVIDETTGHATARWGKPYLTPLIAAVDDADRYAAVYVDRDHVRVFAVGAAAIDEVITEDRPTSPAEWDRLQQGKDVHPGYVPSRGGAAYDNAQHHLETLAKKFYEVISEQIGAIMNSRGLRGLILLGPEAEVAQFERVLPKRLADEIVSHRPSLSRPDAPISEVHERLRDAIRQARERRHQQLLDDMRESGTTGTSATLQALQQGQLAVVATVWRTDAMVWRGKDSGWVAATRDEADHRMPRDEEVERLSLLDAIADLTRQYNTRLVVMRGDAAERLSEELEGTAGLKRW